MNTKIWPSNEAVKSHQFNDQVIDDMTHYDVYARAAFINKAITRDDYLSIERAMEAVRKEALILSDKGKRFLRQALDSV